jgi:hypothetical protein
MKEVIERLEKLCERPSVSGTGIETELRRIIEMIKKGLK